MIENKDTAIINKKMISTAKSLYRSSSILYFLNPILILSLGIYISYLQQTHSNNSNINVIYHLWSLLFSGSLLLTYIHTMSITSRHSDMMTVIDDCVSFWDDVNDPEYIGLLSNDELKLLKQCIVELFNTSLLRMKEVDALSTLFLYTTLMLFLLLVLGSGLGLWYQSVFYLSPILLFFASLIYMFIKDKIVDANASDEWHFKLYRNHVLHSDFVTRIEEDSR